MSSPPFQIGEPPSELTEKDFASVFSGTGDLKVSPIGGGLSGAKIYKVIANCHPYLVRHTSGIFGPHEIASEFAIQKEMGREGISPKIHYSDPERGIIAMDFIENLLPQGRNPDILKRIDSSQDQLVHLMRNVHQTVVPKATPRIALDYIKRSVAKLPPHFLSQQEQHLIERIVKTPWPTNQVTLTHNDFRSDNLLYDNERFWLIDWELGGLSHPLYDLAYFANYQACHPKEGKELLHSYLQRNPSLQEQQTFSEMRRIAYGFAATLALPELAKLDPAILEPRKNEPRFNSLKDLWLLLDAKEMSFSIPRDEYRISLFLLSLSRGY